MNPKPIPDIYVLWHPACALGETLAARIYRWLRPGNGLGPDVFYRSLPRPGAPVGGLPEPLPDVGGRRHTNMQVVVLLIDSHMIADVAWRSWLGRLGNESLSDNRRKFLPIALDFTAFNVPAPLAELNFLRPAGVPLPADATDAAVDGVARSMLKQLTEALCKLLVIGPDSATETNAAPKITIFLSHAKADGTTPARRIRDYIYSQTQLAAFYDENDIPFGSAFARVLKTNVRATAAMIAVQSERYATRPWCRRELSMFRTPVAEPNNPGADDLWRLHPLIVVNALEDGKLTAGIPELGNATHVRWSCELPDQDERVVTLLLRDALLAEFHATLGRSIRDAATGHSGRVVINWLPDPTSILRLRGLRKTPTNEVLYPGQGLSALELDTLGDYFPDIDFLSFDEVTS